VRLQLRRPGPGIVGSLAVLVMLVVAPRASAETQATSKLQVYVDNDATQVISPLARASTDLGATQLTAGCLVDVVTSASVDVVSQASKTAIHDVRTEPWIDVSRTFGRTKISAGYVYSRERDYVSNGGGIALQRGFWDNDTTLALSYRLSLDDVGRAGDANFSRSLAVQAFGASWSQVVTPLLLLQLSYELGYGVGFFASPYRFVPVFATTGASPTTWVPETDPERRLRQLVVLTASRHLFADSAIQADYRFYADDWGMTSHTIEARYLVNLPHGVELRLRERFYVQSKADFYQETYSQIMRFMTFDKELGALWTELVGAKVIWRVGVFELEAKAGFFRFQYLDFAPLASRSGVNVGLGLGWSSE
jgi:hypothetical protein